MYEMQIRIKEKNIKEWVSIRPTGGSPYQYETKQEAMNMLNICYPLVVTEDKRVIETP